MKKADKFKLLYILGISLIFFFTGCVDTSVQNINTSFDFHSQAEFTNLSSVGGAATIKAYDINKNLVATIGPLELGSSTPTGAAFMDMPSGSYSFIVNYGSIAAVDTFKLVLDTERHTRFYLMDIDGTTRNLFKANLRYTWQAPGTANGAKLFPPDTASIMFVNGTPSVEITKVELASTPVTYSNSLTVGAGSPYMMFKVPGSALTCNFYGASSSGSDSLLTSVSFTPVVLGRYSAVLFKGANGALAGKVYTDD